jgi:hypothetical protein
MISYVSFPEDFRTMAWFKGTITGTLPIFIGKPYGADHQRSFLRPKKSVPSEGISEFKVTSIGPS